MLSSAKKSLNPPKWNIRSILDFKSSTINVKLSQLIDLRNSKTEKGKSSENLLQLNPTLVNLSKVIINLIIPSLVAK